MMFVSLLLGPIRRGLRAPARRGIKTMTTSAVVLLLTTCATLFALSTVWTMGEFGVWDSLATRLPDLELPDLSLAPFGEQVDIPWFGILFGLLLFAALIWLLWRVLIGRLLRSRFGRRPRS
jgi:hypothetical protein